MDMDTASDIGVTHLCGVEKSRKPQKVLSAQVPHVEQLECHGAAARAVALATTLLTSMTIYPHVEDV